jgi:hypothetical protein
VLTPSEDPIFGWLGLVVAAVLIGKAAGTNELTQNDAFPGDTGA